MRTMRRKHILEPRQKDVQLFYQSFCNNQDAGLVNLAYIVDDERGELDSNRLLTFPQTPSLTEMITRVSVAGLLTAGMIAAVRYRHFICFLSASHILQCRISTYITP